MKNQIHYVNTPTGNKIICGDFIYNGTEWTLYGKTLEQWRMIAVLAVNRADEFYHANDAIVRFSEAPRPEQMQK